MRSWHRRPCLHFLGASMLIRRPSGENIRKEKRATQTCRQADGQRKEKTDTGTGREEDMCSGVGPAPAVGRQQPPQWTWRGRIRDWHGTWALSLGMAPGQGMGMAPGSGMALGMALDIAMGLGTGHDQLGSRGLGVKGKSVTWTHRLAYPLNTPVHCTHCK